MVSYCAGKATITCDKCGVSQTELESESNERFYNSGWGLSMTSKYKNRCARCLVKAGFKSFKKYLASHPKKEEGK